MKVTYHAAERFLQRVIKKINFTEDEIYKTITYLEKVLKDIVLTSYGRPFPLPGFENQFKVITLENTAITIIPKDKKYQK